MLPPFTFAALGFCGGASASRERVRAACTKSTKGWEFFCQRSASAKRPLTPPLGGKIRLCAPCGPKSPHAEARHTDVLRSLRPVRIRIKPHSANPSPSVQYGRRAAACNRPVRQAGCPARSVRNILRRLRSKTAAPAGNSILAKIVTFSGYPIKIPARTIPFSQANAPHGRPAAPTPRSTRRRAPTPPDPTGAATAGFRE